MNAETLKTQLELSNQMELLGTPYHSGIINNILPLSIGGGIGQSRTLMLLLRKAHLGEVSVTVWPRKLKDVYKRQDIRLLLLTTFQKPPTTYGLDSLRLCMTLQNQ